MLRTKIKVKLPKTIDGKQLADRLVESNTGYFKTNRTTDFDRIGYEIGKEGAIETRRYFDEIEFSKYDMISALKAAAGMAATLFCLPLAPMYIFLSQEVRAKIYHDTDYNTLTLESIYLDESRFKKTFEPKLAELVNGLYSKL